MFRVVDDDTFNQIDYHILVQLRDIFVLLKHLNPRNFFLVLSDSLNQGVLFVLNSFNAANE